MTIGPTMPLRIIILLIGLNILAVRNSEAQTPAEITQQQTVISHNDSVMYKIMERYLISSNHIGRTGKNDEANNRILDSVITVAQFQYLIPNTTRPNATINRYNRALTAFEKMTLTLIDKTTCKLSTPNSTRYMKAYVALGTAKNELLLTE